MSDCIGKHVSRCDVAPLLRRAQGVVVASPERRVRMADDELVDPLRLIDAAIQRYARPRRVSSREIIDVLLDLRSAVVLDAALRSLRDDLIGNRRHPVWLPRKEPS